MKIIKTTKTPKQLEKYFKGAANHRRIEILLLVAESENISVEDIADSLNCNIKTISAHIQKLAQSGLVNKRYQGRIVLHSLSPYGRRFVKFITTF